MDAKIRIGISSCLLGEKVRFDGQAKLDRYLRDTLGTYFDYVPVCPEFECGLGVPRESMRLEGDPENPRLMTNKTRTDLTARMQTWCTQRINELVHENLCGFIFKSKSPSSGMERVKVYQANGQVIKKGSGLFAKAFMERFPLLPVEEEGRLNDPVLRENFIERVFTLQRWRELISGRNRAGDMVAFHAAHKYLLMSHSVDRLRTMGQLIAALNPENLAATQEAYLAELMEVMKRKATVAKHTNVLQHMAGYFKKQLSADERQELQEIITEYRLGRVPLIVPTTLLRHFVRKYKVAYLADQYYLHPHPIELKLRNHA